MTERDAKEQAVEYLQTAAIEAIKAMRSFLDIAESLVREPETAATMAKAFAEAAAGAMRPSTLADDEPDGAESEAHDPTGGVRRIDLD
jgi:hypothetical protein